MAVSPKLDEATKASLMPLWQEVVKLRQSIDFEPQDALALIKDEKNKKFVNDLRGNRIDGKTIHKMLMDCHGLKVGIYLLEGDDIKKLKKEIYRAKSDLTKVIKSEFITDEEEEYLCGIQSRIMEKYKILWNRNRKEGIFLAEERVGEGKAKGTKQMMGLRAAEIYKYINKDKFLSTTAHDYLKNDIYDLIAELFEVCLKKTYTREQIRTLVQNNI